MSIPRSAAAASQVAAARSGHAKHEAFVKHVAASFGERAQSTAPSFTHASFRHDEREHKDTTADDLPKAQTYLPRYILRKWRTWTSPSSHSARQSGPEEAIARSSRTSEAVYDDAHIMRPATSRTLLEQQALEASTSSLDPLADYRKHGLIPSHPGRLRLLFKKLLLDHDVNPETAVRHILKTLRQAGMAGRSKEIEALLALLEADVEETLSRTHVRKLRERPGREKKQASDISISASLYAGCWARLWEIKGQSLEMSSQLAQHVLEHLLRAPAAAFTSDSGNVQLDLEGLRHLLFAVGLDNSPALGLDVLVHLIAPHYLGSSAHDRLSPPPPSPGSAAVPVYEPSSTAYDEIPLVLHDLLRASIISPEAIKEFDLSAAIGKATELPTETFNVLLRQTLLRLAIRSYYNLQRPDRTTLLLRLLRPLPNTEKVARKQEQNAHKQKERDHKLFTEVCRQALQPSPGSGNYVNRVASLLCDMLLDNTHTRSVTTNTAFGNSAGTVATADDIDLLRLYFDTALPGRPLTFPLSYFRVPMATMVWKVLHQTGGLAHFSPSLDQMIKVLAFTSQPYSSQDLVSLGRSQTLAQTGLRPESSLQQDDFIRAIRYVRERIFLAPHECDHEQANTILAVLLNSTPFAAGSATEDNRMKIILQLYWMFSSPSLSRSMRNRTPFVLETRNLVPLIRLARSLPDSPPRDSAAGGTDPTRQEEASSIIQRFATIRGDGTAWTVTSEDFTALAEAYLVNGDRDGALGIFQWMMEKKVTPSIRDLDMLLSDMLYGSPAGGLKYLERSLEKGFIPDRESWAIYQDESVQSESVLTEVAALKKRSMGSKQASVRRGNASKDAEPGSVQKDAKKLLANREGGPALLSRGIAEEEEDTASASRAQPAYPAYSRAASPGLPPLFYSDQSAPTARSSSYSTF